MKIMNEERFNYLWTHNKPAQTKEELSLVVEELEKINPKVVIEIGIWNGGTLQYWWDIIKDKPDSLLICIDPKPRQKFMEDFKTELLHSDNFRYLQDYSGSSSCLNDVKKILNGKKADFIYVDGDHQRGHLDYDDYIDFLRDDGIMAFHDMAGKNVGPPVHKKLKEAGWESLYYFKPLERSHSNLSTGIMWKRKGEFNMIGKPIWWDDQEHSRYHTVGKDYKSQDINRKKFEVEL
jgi:hypothetical protein